MRFQRATYRPGYDRLVYAAVDEETTTISIRVYGPQHHPGNNQVTKHSPFVLEDGIFALDFDFNEVGNYIFIIEENGVIQTILNAKVYA